MLNCGTPSHTAKPRRWPHSQLPRRARRRASVGPVVTFMNVRKGGLGEQLITEDIGEEIFALATKIFPICRSITGSGVRQTLREIGAHVALETHEVPTGTKVFDWAIPKEWNIRDAYVKDSHGTKIIDLQRSNLHVLNYSIPFQGKVFLADLREHLFSDPANPGWIPYRTSYYKENWGFCITHNQLLELQD